MAKQMLGQIFYGRDRDGYGVLGTSPSGRPFLGAVAALCRTVGSPDRPGDVRPFLISKREGDAVLMIRACRGAVDPTGRATIFFHALIADEAALRAAGLDAFGLASAGVFLESCPSGEPSDMPFPSVRRWNIVQNEIRTVDIPATISSERPLDELVRQELGAKSIDLNWTTFSFNPLLDFDICVLSSYSPRKGAGTQYAFDDAGLHRLSPEPVQRKTPCEAGARRFTEQKMLLLLSLAVNVAFIVAALLPRDKTDGSNPDGPPDKIEMAESDAREKWELKWKKEWEQSLPPPQHAMSEAEAREKWEAQWKSEWVKAIPPRQPVITEAEAREKWETQWKTEWEKSLPPLPPAMTEAEARTKWEHQWKAEWEKSLPPVPPAMSETEAKAKWAMQWKKEWEKSLPPIPSAMTEAEAKAKWEAQWKAEWETAYRQKLQSTFEKLLGGNQRVLDFEKEMVKLDPYYEDYKDNKAKPPTLQTMDLYKALKSYVSFVEDTIINPQKQNKER